MLNFKVKKMFDKEDCEAAVGREISKTSRWREEMSLRYPGDPRNSKAKIALEKLAERLPEVPESEWTTLQRFDPDSDEWRKAVSTTARRVGFLHQQPSPRYFLRTIARELAQVTV